MGETGLGILKLLTLGGCGIWALVDWIIIMAGARRDKLGRPLANREKNFKTSVIILVISIGISIVLNIISFVISASTGSYN
jgi:heme/copper-type cytochrome/quinol oxidase subunit 2